MPYKDPERQRTYQRDYRRLRRAGEATMPRLVALPPTFRLKTAADVLALLSEQILAVREDGESTALERARVIGYLGSVALKAIEAGDLAARLEAIEMALKMRKQA
jgi:hypothetical protein